MTAKKRVDGRVAGHRLTHATLPETTIHPKHCPDLLGSKRPIPNRIAVDLLHKCCVKQMILKVR